MEIKKPKWLESWLSHLNWDIFKWQVYVGDALEFAIDFVISWLNDILGLAETADKKAEDAKKFTEEGIKAVQTALDKSTEIITERLDTLPANIREEREASLAELRQEAKFARDAIEAELRHLQADGALTSEAVKALLSDLSTARAVIDSLKARVTETEKETYNLWEAIKDFLTDPASFIYHLADEIIERFW